MPEAGSAFLGSVRRPFSGWQMGGGVWNIASRQGGELTGELKLAGSQDRLAAGEALQGPADRAPCGLKWVCVCLLSPKGRAWEDFEDLHWPWANEDAAWKGRHELLPKPSQQARQLGGKWPACPPDLLSAVPEPSGLPLMGGPGQQLSH